MNRAMEEYAGFLSSYADFLESMVEEEKRKLDALLSLKVEEVERSIARQQSVAKELDQMEQRREELQRLAGFEGLTLRQIADQAPQECRDGLEESMGRFSRAVELIKHYNEKSLELVQENLEFVQSSEAGKHLTGVNAYTPSLKRTDDWGTGANLFEKKI